MPFFAKKIPFLQMKSGWWLVSRNNAWVTLQSFLSNHLTPFAWSSWVFGQEERSLSLESGPEFKVLFLSLLWMFELVAPNYLSEPHLVVLQNGEISGSCEVQKRSRLHHPFVSYGRKCVCWGGVAQLDNCPGTQPQHHGNSEVPGDPFGVPYAGCHTMPRDVLVPVVPDEICTGNDAPTYSSAWSSLFLYTT